MIHPPALWRHQQKFSGLLGQQGVILHFTRISKGPSGNPEHAPYFIALINFPEEKKKMLLAVCHESAEKIAMGAVVELVLRKQKVSSAGLIQYSLKAKIL